MSKRIILLKVALFMVIFSLIFSYLSAVFQPPDSVLFSIDHTFYAQRPNSIDVVYIGASSFTRGIHPLTIWDGFGVTSYVRAMPSNPLPMYFYFLEEFLEYQTPTVVVIDPGKIFVSPYPGDFELRMREGLDPMRLSWVKLQALRDTLSHSQIQTFLSTVFPLIRYHSTWDQLNAGNFDLNKGKEYDFSKGSQLFYIIDKVEFPTDFMKDPGKQFQFSNYDRDAVLYYIKIIELCRKKGIRVLFVTTPQTTWTMARHNTVHRFADRYGVDYLDYNLPENMQQLGLDLSKDFRDTNHLSATGAIKLSQNLGAYLQLKYHLLDKRGQDAYAQWDTDLQLFKQDFANKK